MPFKKIIPGLVCCSFVLFLSAFNKPGHIKKFSNKINIGRDTTPITDTTEEKIFEKVEIEASFPGGEKAWLRYLELNLDASVPVKKKAPVGYYTVLIQFVVDREGYIKDIRPLTAHGYGMEEEVIRILKKAPRWRPANQDGRPVKAYRKQPVTFMVEEDKKRKRN